MELLTQIITGAAPYGPVGLLVIYFVWRDKVRDEREDKETERRAKADDQRVEADKAMAQSLTLLAERINNVRPR